MKLLVAGSRNFGFESLVKRYLRVAFKKLKPELVVAGGAKGPDTWAEEVAIELDIPVKVIKADWSKGRQAGFIRNAEMWDIVDKAIVFWDGQSKGTAHSFELAKKAGKGITICTIEDNKFRTEYRSNSGGHRAYEQMKKIPEYIRVRDPNE